ncbi:hypothetical protein BJX61DRAFT_530304 [Aspergillus egyptiacus]|nr:hypothetical protein BJX61DRAFT_530304 [Aspergillus egyptiacus]
MASIHFYTATFHLIITRRGEESPFQPGRCRLSLDYCPVRENGPDRDTLFRSSRFTTGCIESVEQKYDQNIGFWLVPYTSTPVRIGSQDLYMYDIGHSAPDLGETRPRPLQIFMVLSTMPNTKTCHDATHSVSASEKDILNVTASQRLDSYSTEPFPLSFAQLQTFF